MVNVMTLNADIRAEAEIIGSDGKPLQNYTALIPKDYQGLERFAARKKIVADLETLGLLEQTARLKRVPYGDRGGVPIEPMLTDQWYVSVKPLAEVATKAVKMAKSNLCRNSTKTSTSLGCVIFKTGVFLANYGGDIAFQHGMTMLEMYMLS